MSLSFARQAVQSKRAHIIRHAALKNTVAFLRPSFYSTTATKIEYNNNNKHVILPNPNSEAFKTTARVLPSNIAEQFAILNACIASGNMERAERIMKELYK